MTERTAAAQLNSVLCITSLCNALQTRNSKVLLKCVRKGYVSKKIMCRHFVDWCFASMYLPDRDREKWQQSFVNL